MEGWQEWVGVRDRGTENRRGRNEKLRWRESWREGERERREGDIKRGDFNMSIPSEEDNKAGSSQLIIFILLLQAPSSSPVPLILKSPLFLICHFCCSHKTHRFRLSPPSWYLTKRDQKITFISVCKQHCGIYAASRICWFWWDAGARQQLGGTIVVHGLRATHKQTVKAEDVGSQKHLQSGIWSGGYREWREPGEKGRVVLVRSSQMELQLPTCLNVHARHANSRDIKETVNHKPMPNLISFVWIPCLRFFYFS